MFTGLYLVGEKMKIRIWPKCVSNIKNKEILFKCLAPKFSFQFPKALENLSNPFSLLLVLKEMVVQNRELYKAAGITFSCRTFL
jgi:hypothetical protein